jgi:hypothetical protein
VKTAVQSTVSTVKTVAQSALTQAKQAVDTVKTVAKSAVQSAAKAATTVKSTVATWAETYKKANANKVKQSHEGHSGKITVNSTPVPGPVSTKAPVTTPGPQEVEKYRKENAVGPTPPVKSNPTTGACINLPKIIESEIVTTVFNQENYVFFSFKTGKYRANVIGEGSGLLICTSSPFDESFGFPEVGAIFQSEKIAVSGKIHPDFGPVSVTLDFKKNDDSSTAITLKSGQIATSSIIVENIIKSGSIVKSTYEEITVNKWVIGLTVAAGIVLGPVGAGGTAFFSDLITKAIPTPNYA